MGEYLYCTAVVGATQDRRCVRAAFAPCWPRRATYHGVFGGARVCFARTTTAPPAIATVKNVKKATLVVMSEWGYDPYGANKDYLSHQENDYNNACYAAQDAAAREAWREYEPDSYEPQQDDSWWQSDSSYHHYEDDDNNATSLYRHKYDVGERVKALYSDGKWYCATIAERHPDGTYTLDWDDGDTRQRVKNETDIQESDETRSRREEEARVRQEAAAEFERQQRKIYEARWTEYRARQAVHEAEIDKMENGPDKEAALAAWGRVLNPDEEDEAEAEAIKQRWREEDEAEACRERQAVCYGWLCTRGILLVGLILLCSFPLWYNVLFGGG